MNSNTESGHQIQNTIQMFSRLSFFCHHIPLIYLVIVIYLEIKSGILL